MKPIAIEDTVGEAVTRQPALARIFETAGIDYCCGGKVSLETVCREKKLDPEQFLSTLNEVAASAEAPPLDPANLSLAELADHIAGTHHVYLRNELPRLVELSNKVAGAHGEKDARLLRLSEVMQEMAWELSAHMMKEEQILFPMIRQLDSAGAGQDFHCGSIANPIRQMEYEHETAGIGLENLRDLTDGYAVPEWACNTMRVLLDSLKEFETDLHQHIHKENNILFPRAVAAGRDAAV